MIARIRKAMDEKEQGFTLIELLVVMIIIGILAAIAVPVFLNQRTKAVDTSIKADIKSVASNIETTAVDTQTYPDAITASTGADTGNKIVVGGTDIALSTGNKIAYVRNSAGTGFCLRGSNDKATAKGGSGGTYYYYASAAGGLGASPTATAAAASGCTFPA